MSLAVFVAVKLISFPIAPLHFAVSVIVLSLTDAVAGQSVAPLITAFNRAATSLAFSPFATATL
ncbi:hypothetical protein BV054_00690 [Haemophilus influenzae]|nr:hypothetical protein BV054_00690 [Haemophilus influenzae]